MCSTYWDVNTKKRSSLLQLNFVESRFLWGFGVFNEREFLLDSNDHHFATFKKSADLATKSQKLGLQTISRPLPPLTAETIMWRVGQLKLIYLYSSFLLTTKLVSDRNLFFYPLRHDEEVQIKIFIKSSRVFVISNFIFTLRILLIAKAKLEPICLSDGTARQRDCIDS